MSAIVQSTTTAVAVTGVPAVAPAVDPAVDAPVAKAKDSDSEDEESAVKTKPSRKFLEVGNTTYYRFKLPRGINSISD